jgi:hypothetical protein
MVDTNATRESASEDDMPINKVTYVVRIQEGEAISQSNNTTIKTSIAQKVAYQALILLQDTVNEIDMVSENKIPLSCLPIN